MEAFKSSEGISATMAFLRSPLSDKKAKVKASRPLIDALIGQSEALKESRHITLFALGGLLHVWKKEKLWMEIDEYEDWWQFGNFCKGILKMSLQKANAIIRIWEKSQRIGLQPKEIEEIGWSKAQIIIRAAKNRQETEKWLAEARWYGQENLIAKVRSVTSGIKFDPARTIRRVYRFTNDEADFLDESIEKGAKEIIKKELGTEVSPSEVLIQIVQGWRLSLG